MLSASRYTRRVAAAAALLASLPLSLSSLGRHEKLKEKLVWKETFDQKKTGDRPDPAIWGYEQGVWSPRNGELELYCAWGSDREPCKSSQPNVFVGKDKLLHIVARKTADGRYTSASLISRGKKDFKYGRIEARIRIPRGQGIWPAFWMMGADSTITHWPACGEIDVMENVGKEPAAIHGTIHGQGFPAIGYGTAVKLPAGASFADSFHNYGVLWTPGRIAFYVDDPLRPYAVFTPQNIRQGAIWPFDARPFYLLLNVAVGGDWPGPPDARTRFPSEMLVQWIKVWELQDR